MIIMKTFHTVSFTLLPALLLTGLVLVPLYAAEPDQNDAQSGLDDVADFITELTADIEAATLDDLDTHDAEDALEDGTELYEDALEQFADEDWEDVLPLTNAAETLLTDAIDDLDTLLRADADAALADARELLALAEEALSLTSKTDLDYDDAEDLYEEAEPLLEEAEDALEDEDYQLAEDLADDIYDLAEELFDELDTDPQTFTTNASSTKAALDEIENLLDDLENRIDEAVESDVDTTSAERAYDDATELYREAEAERARSDWDDVLELTSTAKELLSETLAELAAALTTEPSETETEQTDEAAEPATREGLLSQIEQLQRLIALLTQLLELQTQLGR